MPQLPKELNLRLVMRSMMIMIMVLPLVSRASTIEVLRSMINKHVGKAIKNVMSYYISQTTNHLKEVIKTELEEFRKGGIMSDNRNDMKTYRDFTACDVPKFDGALDPITSTRWFVAIEGAFRTSNCK
ncbi:hypothetical protein Tco_0992331 [Tanacetum coccineum]|uniref:Uncharacterized protein n=1 Tax=Tanacetum coccineum TaxID=301880 RepID=A0ABQ5F399_9ASTR